MKLERLKNIQFLSQRLTIKINHLTKDDAKHIRYVLNGKMGSVCFLVSIVLALISLAVFLLLQIGSGWKQAEIYGMSSMIADIVCFVLCMATVIFKLISFKAKNEKTITLLNRLAIDFLYIAVASLMFGSFYADAEKGFLSDAPTMSVSIIIISFLLIVQPIYSLDAWILNLSSIAAMMAIVIYAKLQFDIQSVVYYIFIVIVFILLSRLFISIIFYAEVQKYIQESISNSLLDTAMYDELTHCKNRFALKKYIEEKEAIWKQEETDLLVVMFDIDNFKEYNDYFSHQIGDKCLLNIANAVKKTFPSPGLEFYRYGGEEFLLFFELENDQKPEEVLEKIRMSANELDIKAPPTSPLEYLTISVGGYLLTTNEYFDFNHALNEADTNLYKAKADGKNICYLNSKRVKRIA